MYTVGAESMQVPLDQMVLCCFRRSFRSTSLPYYLRKGVFFALGGSWGCSQGWTQTRGIPSLGVLGSSGTLRESNVELGLWSSQRPGAIVCGRADQYGAPLGSNITSKVALATDAAIGERLGWQRRPPSHGGSCCVWGGGSWASLWGGFPPSPCALGHWKPPVEVQRAAGCDCTSAAPSHRQECVGIGGSWNNR